MSNNDNHGKIQEHSDYIKNPSVLQRNPRLDDKHVQDYMKLDEISDPSGTMVRNLIFDISKESIALAKCCQVESLPQVDRAAPATLSLMESPSDEEILDTVEYPPILVSSQAQASATSKAFSDDEDSLNTEKNFSLYGEFYDVEFCLDDSAQQHEHKNDGKDSARESEVKKNDSEDEKNIINNLAKRYGEDNIFDNSDGEAITGSFCYEDGPICPY